MRTLLMIVGAGAALSVGCGGGDSLRALPNDAPIAVAAIYGGETIEEQSAQFLGYTIAGETATLDARLSRDGDGQIVSWAWTLEDWPEGSELVSEDIFVPEDDPDTEDNESLFPTITPDVLGTYRLGLVVTDNDDAVSEMALVFVQSVPPSGMEIELEWEEAGADLDAHLTTPGGTYFDFEGGSDCFSWNPNPDWGDGNLALDNPELDTDADGVGAGPFRESIYLDTPTDTTEGFLVRVHYYADHVAMTGGSALPANPTVRIIVLENVVAELTPSQPLVFGDVWTVGTFTWPDRVFNQIGTLTTHTELGGPDYNEQ